MIKHSATRILILGAGFGGVYAYKHLHKIFHGNKDVEIAIVSEYNYFLFTPFLHEVATGGISPEHTVEPLRRLFPCCELKIHLTQVVRMMPQQKIVFTARGPLKYDYCIVALGATTNYFGIRGAQQHTFGLKTLDDAIRLKRHCIRLLERAALCEDEVERKKLLRFCIVGGGPTGVELAAELSEFIHDTLEKLYRKCRLSEDAEIILLHRDAELIPQFDVQFRRAALRILRSKRVSVRLTMAVAEVGSDHILLASGEKIDTSTTIWVAGVAPYEVDPESGLTCDAFGRMTVRPTLQHEKFDSVFALGDCACFTNLKESKPLPALAQVAVRQAPIVAWNIYRHMRMLPLKTFRYKNLGMLISLGRWMAFAQIGPFCFSGPLAWWLWRTIYLGKIVSMEKRIRVAIDWTFDAFTPRDISEF